MPYYPVVAKSIRIRDPKSVLVLVPTFWPTITTLTVGIVFIIWPDLLNHTPIGFEPRGVVHHAWHYALLFGSLLALIGQFGVGDHRLRNELMGTLILTGVLMLNFSATIAEMVRGNTDLFPGLLVGFTGATLLLFFTRIYVLLFQPTIPVVRHTSIEGDSIEMLLTPGQDLTKAEIQDDEHYESKES